MGVDLSPTADQATLVVLIALTAAVAWLGWQVGETRREIAPLLGTLDRLGVT